MPVDMLGWRSYVLQTLETMRTRNPHATLKNAMRNASAPYREMRDNIFQTRGALVADEREKAGQVRKRPATARGRKGRRNEMAANSAKANAMEAKADRIEAVQYGGVLDDMRWF